VTPEPNIADRSPKVLDVEPGTYWWCACGRSANQPYCDGSHRGTGFTPVKVEFTEAGRRAFCMCKHTGGQPFCDGSHAKLKPA
jgi:CDGSH-type Zn-finger protein